MSRWLEYEITDGADPYAVSQYIASEFTRGWNRVQPVLGTENRISISLKDSTEELEDIAALCEEIGRRCANLALIALIDSKRQGPPRAL